MGYKGKTEVEFDTEHQVLFFIHFARDKLLENGIFNQMAFQLLTLCWKDKICKIGFMLKERHIKLDIKS